MLTALAILAVFAVLITLPILVGARMVKAGRTEFGRCFVLALLLAVLGFGIGKFVGGLAAFFVGTLIGGLLLSAGLETTYRRGVAISLIASAIQFALGAGLVLR